MVLIINVVQAVVVLSPYLRHIPLSG